MYKGPSGFDYASSSQERDAQWLENTKLRAELEEAEQVKKDERAKAAKEKEAKEKEMRDKAAKDKGAGGTAGEVEEEGGRRSHSTGESGNHPEDA